ncbi:MAG TPA: CmpA/NrtA family ABC transporter substrate-binding protein [Opitutaceae bacterium]|nr:CmpA/NrtA family ABC transporter substrate-binding protein [Opitutaceae bacterium]
MTSAVRSKPLRVGFLALADAAPFAAAQARGLFVRMGLAVELRREVGWATIREKIIGGELDAAQSPAPMLWATHLGLDSAACPVLTGLVLNLNGNAITLSERLWAEGVRDGATLREAARRQQGEKRLTFGVVFAFSSHHLMLRAFLREAGLDPERDVRIVVVPPAQMFRNLAAGTLDGYCAGEPWNSLAVREGQGWCPEWSAARHPGHVEKVLMVTERFAERRPTEHAALIAALTGACAWCDQPENREELAELMSGPGYVNQPARILRPSLAGRFDCGHGRVESVPDFHVFHRGGANLPTASRAAAIQEELSASGLLREDIPSGLPSRLFREELFRGTQPNPIPHALVTT